jgi:hypothetical protein
MELTFAKLAWDGTCAWDGAGWTDLGWSWNGTGWLGWGWLGIDVAFARAGLGLTRLGMEGAEMKRAGDRVGSQVWDGAGLRWDWLGWGWIGFALAWVGAGRNKAGLGWSWLLVPHSKSGIFPRSSLLGAG